MAFATRLEAACGRTVRVYLPKDAPHVRVAFIVEAGSKEESLALGKELVGAMDEQQSEDAPWVVTRARDERFFTIARLRLAQSDMRQAIDAGEGLLDEAGRPFRRALETALVVCYWRPFSNSTIGGLSEEWTPRDPARTKIHDRARQLRNQVFAHTDETTARGVVDVGDVFGPEWAGRFVETWRPLPDTFVRDLVSLAREYEQRLKDAANDLQEEIAAGR
jgi:hypothetical protein